jgi:predicted dehydrogenase
MSVRVGIIGIGFWAPFMYLARFASHSGASVVALSSRNRERAQEVADRFGVPKVYTDYREMIASGDLDAVVVAAPDDLHHPMALAAREAGLHVLCVKPLASTSRQAAEMYRAAQARGVKHMVMFTYRWMPYFVHVHNLIREGYIGRPYQANFHYTTGYARSGDYAWRFDGSRANGVLGDLGSHMIDLSRWFVGEVGRVNARLGTNVERRTAAGETVVPANDSATLLIEFENGAQGSIQLSAVSHVGERSNRQGLIICGSEGTLEVQGDFAQGAAIHGARNGDDTYRELPLPGEQWRVQAADDYLRLFTELFDTQSVGPRAFIDAIIDDRPSSPGFYDGWRAQAVIDAALESDRTGQWIAPEGDAIPVTESLRST